MFGGYLIFWTALHFDSKILRQINSSRRYFLWRLSVRVARSKRACLFLAYISPWPLTLLTIPIVYAWFASWRLVERRFLTRHTPLAQSCLLKLIVVFILNVARVSTASGSLDASYLERPMRSRISSGGNCLFHHCPGNDAFVSRPAASAAAGDTRGIVKS